MVLAVGVVLSLGLAAGVVRTMQNPPGEAGRTAQRLAADPAKTDQARSAALAALKRSPIDPFALSALGFAAEASGDTGKANRLLRLAGKVSRRDPKVEAWLMQSCARVGDFTCLYEHADSLLRRSPSTADALFPYLASSSMASTAAANALAKRLATKPLWRASFIDYMAIKFAEPGAMFPILEALATGEGRRTDREVSLYLERLMNNQRYEQALVSWLLFMPADRLQDLAGLYDGQFRGLDGPTPFNWSTYGGLGAQVQMAASPDRPHDPALHVEYDGFNNVRLISQAVILAPGEYKFAGEILARDPAAADFFRWTMTCMGDNRVLMQTRIKGGPARQSFEVPVEIPQDCPAQMVELKPTPGERTTDVDVWFDNLTIMPAVDF